MASKHIWIEKELIKSPAYAAINKPTAFRVLMIFFLKRQMERIKYKNRGEWIILNNGEIEFTYLEAKNKYGISETAFRDAIDELMKLGFIDIVESGAGVYKAKNLYAISNRWRKYDTPEYEPPKARPKGPTNKGFKKGNHLGRNSRKNKNQLLETTKA